MVQIGTVQGLEGGSSGDCRVQLIDGKWVVKETTGAGRWKS